jgi:tight adherence protein C
MSLYLYIGLGLVFIFSILVVITLALPVFVKKTPRTTINKIVYYGTTPKSKEETASLFERMGKPFFARLASVLKRMSPSGISESTRHKLELAGILETVGVDIYLATKVLLPVGFLFLFILLIVFLHLPIILIIVLIAFIPISYFLPDVFLRNKIANRQEEIRTAIPNALDLLTISVDAGMSFNIALSKVAGNIGGALGYQFNKMLKEIQIGFTRREAFKNLDKRTEVPDLSAFISAMIQADVFGISIGKVLRVQASEMRIRRRQRAEEIGVKAPVKLVFPTILCLFPALLVVVMGPAAIRIWDTLIKVLME